MSNIDFGAEPRLTLSLGFASVNLIRRAIGRLDTDDQREAETLGLKGALDEFLAANASRHLEGKLRALLSKQNMRDEHPLPFSDVVAVIAKALAIDLTPEPGERPDDAQLGVASFGRFDDKGGVKHVFVLALADATWVTVGIASGMTRWAEAGVFWPELQMHSNRWSEHRKRYLKWIDTPAGDRWSFPRAEAEALVKAHGGS